MLQTIASLCSIGSFFVAICILLAGKPQWQWYLLFGISLLFIIVALIGRKHKLGQSNKIITLKGVQPLPCDDIRTEIEVFYPKTFEHSPNLTIRFQKMSSRGRWAVGEPNEPKYKITEQRADGFKLEVSSFSKGAYKPIIKWQAKGEFVAKHKNISPWETGEGI